MSQLYATEISAIFLDRDGVLNHERKDYVKSWHEFEWLPGALDALKLLATRSWPIVVITNQSAIGRQLVTEHNIQEIHAKLSDNVVRSGGRIDAIFVCPHHPDAGCACRKPKPGLLLHAAQTFQLNLERCLFIGDSITDYQAAAQVNCQTLLVKSPLRDIEAELRQYLAEQLDHRKRNHHEKEWEDNARVRLCPDLLAAAKCLLASSTKS
jgi:D-glycero-D-manno-heptose 1,7-bisphosphate phosphatase